MLKRSGPQSTNGNSRSNIKRTPLTSTDLNPCWTKFAFSILTHLTPKSSASHCEWHRKQSVDREDGDGKYLGEQIGSCPTSALRTVAAGTADLKRSPSSGFRASWGFCAYTEWLNLGIRGTAAHIKTERETYPSGAINEGEIRCVVSVCVCVCVWAPLPSDTHTETVHFANSNSQKPSHEKGDSFKR